MEGVVEPVGSLGFIRCYALLVREQPVQSPEIGVPAHCLRGRGSSVGGWRSGVTVVD